MSKYRNYIIIAGLILIILFLGYLLFKSRQKLKEQVNMYEVAQDSITTFRNEKGQLVTKVNVLSAISSRYFLQLQFKDSVLKELQDLVKQADKGRKNVELALIVKNEIIQSLRDSLTRNQIINQTIIDSAGVKYVYPTYHKLTQDKWIKLDITLGRNDFKSDLSIHDDFDFVAGTEGAGFMKLRNYAQLTSKNPYSATKDMRVYQEKPVPNKQAKTGIVSGIIGFIAGLLVHLL
jgi:hypothetical protein